MQYSDGRADNSIPILWMVFLSPRHCENALDDPGKFNLSSHPVWSGKEAHWSLRGLIVKTTEHCGADYKPLDR